MVPELWWFLGFLGIEFDEDEGDGGVLEAVAGGFHGGKGMRNKGDRIN